jgi:hypothetical protein
MKHSVLLISILFCIVIPAALYSETADTIGQLFLADQSDNTETHTNMEDQDPPADYSFAVVQNWRTVFSPGSDLYPRYIANPRRPMFSLSRLWMIDSGIPQAGKNRLMLRLGGRYGFFRVHPKNDPDKGFQFDLEGAFIGVFDIDNSLDNIGWDGLYGALFTWSNGKSLALKFGTKHDSSHVGDEYAERTGRQRISYTREELLLGASLAGLKYWRIYGETGYAYDMRNEVLQKPWRLESGIEFEDARRWWNERAGYYAALDVTSYEESDWQADVTIQAGLVIPVRNLSRTYRFGLEYYNGRSLVGEFFLFNESYISLGFWMDL